jgi:hypothetical protein
MSKKNESKAFDKNGNDKPGYYRGEKLKSGVTQEFVDRIEALATVDKRDLIVEIQKQIDDANTFLKTKQEILDLQAQLDLIKGPTQDTLRDLKNRTKFLIDRLKEVEPSKTLAGP